jgi:hypothetical protein
MMISARDQSDFFRRLLVTLTNLVSSVRGLGVEYPPSKRVTRVRVPANAYFLLFFLHEANYIN